MSAALRLNKLMSTMQQVSFIGLAAGRGRARSSKQQKTKKQSQAFFSSVQAAIPVA
jgi:hypothetical protein